MVKVTYLIFKLFLADIGEYRKVFPIYFSPLTNIILIFLKALTASATDESDTRSLSSNYGKCVDIFAPGVAIRSVSYNSNDGISIMSGTSMACAHVAGELACAH